MENLISKLPFYTKLSEDEIKFVTEKATVKSYGEKEIIHGSSVSCLGFLYVISGSLRAYILSREGREVTLFKVGEGECCVLSAACVISQITFDTFIETECKTDILLIGPASFSKLASENIYVECFMYKLMCSRFSAVMNSVQQIMFERIDSRLAEFLLKESEKRKVLPYTQQEIALQLSTAREVISRALRRFENDGLVKLGRRRITVINPEGLKNISE